MGFLDGLLVYLGTRSVLKAQKKELQQLQAEEDARFQLEQARLRREERRWELIQQLEDRRNELEDRILDLEMEREDMETDWVLSSEDHHLADLYISEAYCKLDDEIHRLNNGLNDVQDKLNAIA